MTTDTNFPDGNNRDNEPQSGSNPNNRTASSSSSSFDEILAQEKARLTLPRSNILPPQIVDAILTAIAQKYNFPSNDHSIAVLTVLFHQGGTARSCDGNLTIPMFEKEIKLSEIRKILKEQNAAKCERKLAKSLATKIHEIAKKLGIPGNLYNLISRENPGRSFLLDEQCWLSDFQATNEDAPASLRELINNSFKKQQKPNPSPKQKKTGK